MTLHEAGARSPLVIDVPRGMCAEVSEGVRVTGARSCTGTQETDGRTPAPHPGRTGEEEDRDDERVPRRTGRRRTRRTLRSLAASANCRLASAWTLFRLLNNIISCMKPTLKARLVILIISTDKTVC